MMPVSGQPLGSRYLLETPIGRGGMGEVWRGRDLCGDAVAIKLLLPQFAQDIGIVQRFVAERAILTSVSHPNIVGVRDLVIEGSTLGIVMDLVEGCDLRHHLSERGTLTPSEVCRIGAQIASGLAAIHAQHIVHRDVKPENILLDQTVDPPQVRLTDFGVAKLIEEGPTQYQGTVLAGTPMYMAPEVVVGAVPTPKADLYGLGIVLYELICGVTPFAGLAPGPMMHAHVTADPGRPVGVAERLWDVVASLTRKSPSERPPDAGVVATYLDQLSVSLLGQPRLGRLPTPPPAVPATGSMHQVHVYPPVDVTQVSPSIQPTQAPWAVPGLLHSPQGWAATPAHVFTPPTVVGPSSGPPGTPPYAQPYTSLPPAGSAGSAYSGTPQRNRTPIVVGVSVGMALMVIGLTGFMVLNLWDGWAVLPTDMRSAERAASADATTQAPPQTAVVTVTAAPPAPSGTHTTAPQTSATRTTTAPLVWPPEGTKECSSVVAVNEVTSCPFASKVADAYRHHGVGTVRAYSPVTEQWYDMSCAAGSDRVVKCTGGNDAAVYIRP